MNDVPYYDIETRDMILALIVFGVVICAFMLINIGADSERNDGK